MAKANSSNPDRVTDFGPAIDRSSELDGYTVNFVTITQTHDLGPMLASLPGGNCSCPHWGVVTAGRLTVHYADREDDVIEAGDAYYMTPGHVPEVEAGTEFVMFSPAAQLAATDAAIVAALQAAPT